MDQLENAEQTEEQRSQSLASDAPLPDDTRAAATCALLNPLVRIDTGNLNLHVRMKRLREENPHDVFSETPATKMTHAQTQEFQGRIEAWTKPIQDDIEEAVTKCAGIARHLIGVINDPALWETNLRTKLRLLGDALCAFHLCGNSSTFELEAQLIQDLAAELYVQGTQLQDACETLAAAASQARQPAEHLPTSLADALAKLLRAAEKHRLTFLYFGCPKRLEGNKLGWKILDRDERPQTRIPPDDIDAEGEFLFRHRFALNLFAQMAIGTFGPGEGSKPREMANDGKWYDVEGGGLPVWSFGDLECEFLERSSDALLAACKPVVANDPERKFRRLLAQVNAVGHDSGQPKWYSSMLVSWGYLVKLDEVILAVKRAVAGIEGDGDTVAQPGNRGSAGSPPASNRQCAAATAWPEGGEILLGEGDGASPSAEVSLPKMLRQLHLALHDWADNLGDAAYTIADGDTIEPRTFAEWLRHTTAFELRMATSALEVTKGPKFAGAFQDRFNRLYGEAEAYNARLKELACQPRSPSAEVWQTAAAQREAAQIAMKKEATDLADHIYIMAQSIDGPAGERSNAKADPPAVSEASPSFVKDLSIAVAAALGINALDEITNLYPNSAASDEVASLRKSLVSWIDITLTGRGFERVKLAIEDPATRKDAGDLWHSMLPGLLFSFHPEAGLDDLAGLSERMAAVVAEGQKLSPPIVATAFARIVQMQIADCRMPHPASGTTYKSPKRLLMILQQYWHLCRALVLDQTGAKIGWQPHPLLPLVVNAKARMEACFDGLSSLDKADEVRKVAVTLIDLLLSGEPDDLSVVPEYTFGEVAKVDSFLTEAQLLLGSSASHLTRAEQTFITAFEQGATEYRDRVERTWRSVLRKVDVVTGAQERAQTSSGPKGLSGEEIGMDSQEVDDFLNSIKSDQEQAELENRRINRVKAEAFALLRALSHNWQSGADMANSPKERQTAVVLLIWSGLVEARFGLTVYSELPTIRAEAIVKGPWENLLSEEIQRQLGRFIQGRISFQGDAQRKLRLTGDGEQRKFDLKKHPDKAWIIWQFMLNNQATPWVGLRLSEAAGATPDAAAIASAEATAIVGNVTVNNTIDLGMLTEAVQLVTRHRSATSIAEGGEVAIDDGKGPAEPAGAAPRKWDRIDEIERQIKRLAPTNCSILFLGDTGTGKEFYAKKVHDASPRKRKQFVAVNCATLPKERIDSELFGHRKGSFTGATQDSPGTIRQAEGGTVFLDEIGDLPDDCWGNLLRFLQSKEIQPIGGKTATVDVRILAATNQPDRIRVDAMHRFDHVLRLPPLRAHREDVAALSKAFFDAANAVNGRRSLRFPQNERTKLGQDGYDWPGNVRQLQKAIQRAVQLHQSGRYLTAQEVIDAAKMV